VSAQALLFCCLSTRALAAFFRALVRTLLLGMGIPLGWGWGRSRPDPRRISGGGSGCGERACGPELLIEAPTSPAAPVQPFYGIGPPGNGRRVRMPTPYIRTVLISN
jgi:hypothetical protein